MAKSVEKKYHCFSRSSDQPLSTYDYQFAEADRADAIKLAKQISGDYKEVFIIEGNMINIK
jgi:hypothetical protein